jgi:predicted membrane channel-forming protein YqfA (hemolysin III family)
MLLEEKVAMFVVTGLSNFGCFPGLYLLYQKNLVFTLIIGVFTFICSFMYHSMESLEINVFYLTRADWHKLDNIGAIMTLICLFVYLMDNLEYANGTYISKYENKVDRVLYYTGLVVTLVMQTKHPWDLENTVFPILLYFCIGIGKILFVRKPRIKARYFYRGCGILALAFVCFYKGLDDSKDYLRIWHGLWHICGSLALFNFYQSIRKHQQIDYLYVETDKRYPYYPFLPTFFKVCSLGFYEKTSKS